MFIYGAKVKNFVFQNAKVTKMFTDCNTNLVYNKDGSLVG